MKTPKNTERELIPQPNAITNLWGLKVRRNMENSLNKKLKVQELR